MQAALNLCEWKLKHNIKTAAFEGLSKLLKKHMLPKDGSELTETWYQMEQCMNVPDIKKYIVHCCPCDEHRYGHSLDGDCSYDGRCPRCNLMRWTTESMRHPRPAIPQPRKFYYDFNVSEKMDVRMALVTLTSDFGRPVRPMLPSAGTSGVVCANWTCEDYLHFAEIVVVLVLGEECRPVNEYIMKQREEGFKCLLTYAQMCSVHLHDEMMKLILHNLVRRVRAHEAARGSTARYSELWMERTWETAGADDAVDSEGTGPGCRGAAVQACTLGAPTTWTDYEVALANTGRIVEDVRRALFRGQATKNHIRVHREQPQSEDAFGYAFADILNNCADPNQYDASGKKHLIEGGSDMGTGVKNASVDVPSLAVSTSQGRESTLKAKDKAVLSDVFAEC
eukprot:jgi/Tetstr1/448376/TSEL_035658.t1